jgi:hypothetical protein
MGEKKFPILNVHVYKGEEFDWVELVVDLPPATEGDDKLRLRFVSDMISGDRYIEEYLKDYVGKS